MIDTGVNIKGLVGENLDIKEVINELKKVRKFREFEDRYGRTLNMVLEYISDYVSVDEKDELLEDIYDFADDYKLGICY